MTRLLAKIKDEYPDDENCIFVPDNKIRYEVLISAMDATREDRDNPGPDGARLLFPFVVIAGGAM
jgi:hypothetical protein